jgi:hypothetical protein
VPTETDISSSELDVNPGSTTSEISIPDAPANQPAQEGGLPGVNTQPVTRGELRRRPDDDSDQQDANSGQAPVQEPVNEPVEEPVNEPVEEPVNEPVNEPVEEPVNEPVEEPDRTIDGEDLADVERISDIEEGERLTQIREELERRQDDARDSDFFDENRDPFDFGRDEPGVAQRQLNERTATSEQGLFSVGLAPVGGAGLLPPVGRRRGYERGETRTRRDVDDVTGERSDSALDIDIGLFEPVDGRSDDLLESPLQGPSNQIETRPELGTETPSNTTSNPTETTTDDIERIFEDTFSEPSDSSRDRLRFGDDGRDDDDDGAVIGFGISDRVFETGVADPGDVLDGLTSSSSAGSSDPFDGVDDALDPFE